MTYNLGKIDWDNSVWEDSNNLKLYIHEYGNPGVNLNAITDEDLMNLAKATEKGRVMLDIMDERCIKCGNEFKECFCIRCDLCYATQCDCPILKKIIFVKTFVFVPINIDITLMQLKIKLKVFVSNVMKNYCKGIQDDILELIMMIGSKWEINPEIRTLKCLFDKTIEKPKIQQVLALRDILKHLRTSVNSLFDI